MEHPFQHEGGNFSRDREGRFLRLNFVSVYVGDQERSKKFFVEQLGFRLMTDVKFPSGYRWIEVAPPDGTARLALVVQAPEFMEFVVPGHSSLITFMAEDVEARYREWSERGVRFPTPPYTPEWGGKFCRFQDPDGNLFGLSGFDGVTLAIEKRREAEARHREAERLAAQELDLAKQVQMRLLPQALRAVPTVDCAGICLQARAVGGDYYDFLDLGKDRLALVVGDIAGKGMGAALLMANLQATLRSQSARLADCPEKALTLVNRMLFENTEPRAYATLFYAEYDSVSRRLRYANCGHLPGLLFRGTQVENLQPGNTVIGLFDVWECSVSETTMAEGDLLVLYTDGVTEAASDSEEEFGERRLIDAVFRNRHLSAQDLVQAISAEVLEFGGGKQNDDITIAITKRLAEPSLRKHSILQFASSENDCQAFSAAAVRKLGEIYPEQFRSSPATAREVILACGADRRCPMNPVEKALWFIESHFASDLTLEDVANAAGVSRFYMTRAFGTATNRSIMSYVRGRRLSEAAKTLMNGASDILSVALDAGYSSHEAFTRAFRAEFGLTPEVVRAQRKGMKLELIGPIKLNDFLTIRLDPPRFENGERLLVAGLAERYSCEASAAIPSQWQRFAPHLSHIPRQIRGAVYGVFCNDDDAGNFDYVCAVGVKDFSGISKSWTCLRIPEQCYAAFRQMEHISTVRSVWNTILNHWLPTSGYQAVDAPAFERYDNHFNSKTGLGGFEVWIPIEAQGQGAES